MKKQHKCPACGRKVGPRHFACELAKRAAQDRDPKSQRRGDSKHYSQLAAQRWAKKQEKE